MLNFFEWSDDDSVAAEILSVTDPNSAWRLLLDRYSDRLGNSALARVLEIAKNHGTKAVLVERRYIDADWRSEHAQFYSTTFTRYPSVTHRLHFFTCEVSDHRDSSACAGFYVGYCVLRPVASAPVGRTMIKPPAELEGAVRCEATERVDVLGWPMHIAAMPFISQDGQYTRCAHADLWMALRHAHLRGQVSRKLPSQVHDSTLGGYIVGRQVPSDGLSEQQMLNGLTGLGLSPAILPLPSTADKSLNAGQLSLFGILCRYVNSNIAPMVISNSHVWTIVAYTRNPSSGHTGLTLYRHDDALGPYLRVNDPWNETWDAHKPWASALLPLPPKIYMTAERAEAVGSWWFTKRIQGQADGTLREVFTDQELRFVTYGIDSSEYKFGLQQRLGMDEQIKNAYRLSLWPRNLWVVEAVDRRLRQAGKPSVLGEVIIDPTANHQPTPQDPGILAAHSPGLLWSATPDSRKETSLVVGDTPYASGRPSS